MKRTLLATTALAALLTTGALAQSDTSTATDPMANQSEPGTYFNEDAETTFESTDGYFEASPDQILASNIIGKTVYNGTSDDAEAIGDVNDVILAPDGSAEAVVIGVGGFLGMGQKEVALDFANVHVFDNEGDAWLTIDANREDLEAAPEFDRSVFDGQMAMDTAANLPATEDDGIVGAGNGDTGAMPAEETGMQTVELDAMSADELLGARVYAENEQDIGEIGDVILSDEGEVETYVIDVGGFLGIGEKPVALAASDLEITQDQNGWLTVHTPFSKEELESQPTFDPETYESDPESVILR